MEHLSEKQSNNTQLHILLSRISHEIRNPVALLKSQVQLLSDNHPELTAYEGWENLEENLEYLTELLNELSNYNHADLLHLEPVNMTQFLMSVLASARPALDYLDITLQIHLDETLPTLSIDCLKMRQVLLNLLRNAQEAISPPGFIYVEAFCKNEKLFISIKDNGCGIPREYLRTLFEPFVTHKSGGTGLGLAIVKQVIEAHNGTIQVESIPGQGSCFTVILPAEASNSQEFSAAYTENTLKNGQCEL